MLFQVMKNSLTTFDGAVLQTKFLFEIVSWRAV